MEDFEQKAIGDVVIEVVNLSRATFKEANDFRQILQTDIIKKFKNIVVDISQVEFMDSTFLGTLVIAKKGISQIGGEIKIIEPVSVFQTLMEKTSTLSIFQTYKTVEDAVNSFKTAEVTNTSIPLHV